MAFPKVLCFEKIKWELAGCPGRNSIYKGTEDPDTYRRLIVAG